MLPLSIPAAEHSSCWEAPPLVSRANRIRYCRGRTPHPASTSLKPARTAAPTRDSRNPGSAASCCLAARVSITFMLCETVAVIDSDRPGLLLAPRSPSGTPGRPTLDLDNEHPNPGASV